MRVQKLSEGVCVEFRKACNGVIVSPARSYDDRVVAYNEFMVFDSVEPLIEWIKEFFPEQDK